MSLTPTISRTYRDWALFALCMVLFQHSSLGTSATYSRVYVFGDGVCTTTDSPSPANLYHGGRRCNGLVWVESFSKWLGQPYVAADNKSYFGHDSAALNTNLAVFSPVDAATSLFIVWCANADFVNYANDGTPWQNSSIGSWNSKISTSINNHTTAVNTLYDKGARIIVMPNAANIAAIPLYNNRTEAEKEFVKNRVKDFNAQFRTAMKNLAASKTELNIVIPDVYAFFDRVQTNSQDFGMNNPVPNNAATIHLTDKSLNGPGANFVFWDPWHPTAKFQMHLASFIRQEVMPVKVTDLSFSGGNVHLTVANIPLGRDGTIWGSGNLLSGSWEEDQPIAEPSPGGSQTKTFPLPVNGPRRFYKVEFPVVWTWP